MCKRYKSIIILIILFYSTIIISKENEYPVLDKAYFLGISGGVGAKSLSHQEIILTTLAIDSEFMIIDSFGLSISDYLFLNNKKDFFLGNSISLAINVRPMFAIRFIKNKFSRNYFSDYFYNSISLNFGGIAQYTKFKRDNIEKNITTIGTKIGFSFAFLLSYDKTSDFYIKTSIDYNFLQEMMFFNEVYNMDGLYIQVTLGISFRFGENIDWLVGANENDKKVNIKFKK